MTFKMSKIGFWLTFVVSLLLFFSPVSVGGGDEFDLDKLVHAFVFFILIITANLAYPKQKFLMTFLLFAYAFGSEYIQGNFLPSRHFDWYDITADSAGLFFGAFLMSIFKKK